METQIDTAAPGYQQLDAPLTFTEAAAIDAAVKGVLARGFRTGDIYVGEGTKVGCTEMGRLVAEAV